MGFLRCCDHMQVAGSPWLSRAQMYIKSPYRGTDSPAPPMIRSAPATLERQPTRAALEKRGTHGAQVSLGILMDMAYVGYSFFKGLDS